MKINGLLNKTFSLISLFSALVIYYKLTESYIGGDQIGYRKLYSALENSPILLASILSRSYVGGGEPVYAILVWIGSNLQIEKDIYISFFNSVLLYSIYKFCAKNSANIFFISLLLSNYYLIVLATSAERLKFAIALIFISQLIRDKKSLSQLFGKAAV